MGGRVSKYFKKEEFPKFVKIDTCKLYSTMFIEKILNQDEISRKDLSRKEELEERKKKIEKRLEELSDNIVNIAGSVLSRDEYAELSQELQAVERGLKRISDYRENKDRLPQNISPTEIIFGQLISYSRNNPVNSKVVAKVFIDMTAFSPDFRGYDNWEEFLLNIHNNEPELIPRWGQVIGLKYEMKAYDYIQKHIIEPRLTINLVPLIAEGYCTIDISNSYFLQKMYGSILLYTSKKSTPVGIIMTKRMGIGGNVRSMTTLRKFSEKHKDDDELLQKIYFQLLYTLAILGEYKIMHNDLHSDNVLVEEYITPVTFSYNINFMGITRNIKFTTKYIPYIFDWDHSYIQSLGDNYMNDLNIAGIYQGVLNRFNPKFDLYTLLCTTHFPKIFKNYLPITDDKKRFLWEDNVFEITYNQARTIENNSDRIQNNVYRIHASVLGQFVNIRKDAGVVIFNINFPQDDNHPAVLRILKSNHNCRRPSLPDSFPKPVDLLFSDCFNLMYDNLISNYNFTYNFSSVSKAYNFKNVPYDGFSDTETINKQTRVQTPYLKPANTPDVNPIIRDVWREYEE